jgi:hypothetical protein
MLQPPEPPARVTIPGRDHCRAVHRGDLLHEYRRIARTRLRTLHATRPVSGSRCSQIADRRCAYTWTSEHTSVVNMQVRRTATYAAGRDGTGWWGSTPGIPTTTREPCGGTFDLATAFRVGGVGRAALGVPDYSRKAFTDQAGCGHCGRWHHLNYPRPTSRGARGRGRRCGRARSRRPRGWRRA